MKKIIYAGVLLILSLACTKNFGEYNKDPYGISDAELATIPVGASDIAALQIWIHPSQENLYQLSVDMPATLSGLTTQGNHIEDFPVYKVREGWNDYTFNDTQEHLYKHYNGVMLAAKYDKEKPAVAIATIIRAVVTHKLASMYGGIPYSAYTGETLAVGYDSQRELFLGLLKNLKESCETLDKLSPEYRIYQKYDVVYDGDFVKWAKYARSVALRIAIQISKAAPAEAKEYAEWAVANGVIEKNEDNALQKTEDNPQYKVSTTWNETWVNADIVEYMKAFNDPRMEKMFTKVGTGSDTYRGLRNGGSFNLKNTAEKGEKYSKPLLEKNSPIVLFSAAEVAFLKAEGALLGWNMGGEDAKTLYEEGVKLSFEYFGIDANTAKSYLQETGVREQFTDNIIPEYNMLDFSSPITVNWDAAKGDIEKQRACIITQKWINFFPYHGVQAWIEWRRTGYPNLLPSVRNLSGNVVANITQVDGKDVGGMRRLVYPAKEKDQNATAVATAIADLKGPDTNATDLWWAK